MPSIDARAQGVYQRLKFKLIAGAAPRPLIRKEWRN
jgi:hypothetical protein